MKGCPHPKVDETVADENEITACCAAACSVDEFGVVYCKCCYAAVTGGEPVHVIRFTLPTDPTDEWRTG